jgi:class 3 adenylate cyclase
MICPKCRSENREGITFCEQCGAKMESECPKRNARIPLGKKFCGECGHNLAESSPPKISPTSEKTGERKQVTVLFSDLTGYTALSENLDPEEVKEMMSLIFGKIAQVIDRYEGFVEKYAGDAVMAVFGVPDSHEDDPIRAIKAAIEIHDMVLGMSPQFEGRVGQPLG